MLKINDLIVAFETERGELTAVNGVSLTLEPGETLALVGESGCGKTVLCKSMLKILCERGNIKQGEILLEGEDLVPLGEEEMIPYRGSGIAMVFQDPMTSLDPTMPVGEQIAEMARLSGCQPEAARERALSLMHQVEIDQPELRYSQMPHHFSGGMRQRIAIAIALAGDPKLLLADEPTTALDQQTQTQILELLKKIDIATIFITHDLSLVEDVADRVAIMQNGEIVETGPVAEVFADPQHPYTRRLLGYLDYGKGRGHSHKHRLLPAGESAPRDLSGFVSPEPLVEVRDIKKYFPIGRKKVHKALDGFSMEIHKGEILGIVGPSGCGKSTLARCIMGMYPLTGGEIIYHNTNQNRNWKQMIFQDSDSAFNPRMTIGDIIAEPMKIAEKQKGILFTRSAAAGSPASPPASSSASSPASPPVQAGTACGTSACDTAFDPFPTTCQYCKNWKAKMSMRDRVIDLMQQVELDPALIDRHPYEVSGGQRQRAAIARAISVDPELIIADEPISSLDISTQAQIVHLFRKLQEERNLTILFIAHDLPMVNHISDRIIEMG